LAPVAVAYTRCRPWDDEHAVDLVDAVDDADHPVGVDVDFDDVAGTEVGDEQQPAVGVDFGRSSCHVLAAVSSHPLPCVYTR
jgi:hypothetical protein